jgi:hypothetical protein
LSFFDDDDDEPPRGAPRTRPAGGRGPAGPSGGGGYDAGHEQAIQQRRTIAVVAIVVIVVVMALLIKSCQSSATTSALKTYNASVSQLIGQSDATGSSMFHSISGASGDISTVVTELAGDASSARSELNTAEGLSAPSAMSSAQTDLVLAMQERYNAIEAIANNIQPAVGGTVSAAKSAVTSISQATYTLASSDVVYKSFVAIAIAEALHGDGIPVGGLDGLSINSGQILNNLAWEQPTYIATEIGAKVPGGVGSGVNTTIGEPGVHGHILNFVSVDGTQLSEVTTNTLSTTPAPTFVLNLTNGGQYPEYEVQCTVSVIGQVDGAETTIAETTANETTTCAVTLPREPAAGPYQVDAEVKPVPGETNTANNSLTFPVDFTG